MKTVRPGRSTWFSRNLSPDLQGILWTVAKNKWLLLTPPKEEQEELFEKIDSTWHCDKWFVTGFSTWPESKVRNDVYRACNRHIENDMKTGVVENKTNAKEVKNDYAVKTAALLNKIRTQSKK